MVKNAQSIRFRITLLTLAAVLTSVLLIGSISIAAIKREGDRDTSRQMNLICDDSSKSINEFLRSVEQSVNMVSRYAAESLSSEALENGGVTGATGSGDFQRRKDVTAEMSAELNAYLDEHARNVRDVFHSVANHTHGLISYYYCINPQLTAGQLGFLYSLSGGTTFSQVEMMVLSDYDPEDIEHVGWYYVPLKSGKPVWMEPYYNKNLNAKMISFVAPIYKADTFIGVIGMDIGYNTLVEQVDSIHLFDTGYAYLARKDGEIIYHPRLEVDTLERDFAPELTPTSQYLTKMESTGELTIPYTYNGIRKEMAFTTLANGMKLIVVAPDREINATWHRLVNSIVITAILILILFTVITTAIVQRITRPLKRLTTASQRLIAGDFDVDLDYTGHNEVGILTEAFKTLTDHLQLYISDLNSKAYRDALTSVRNKGSFDIFARKLNDAIVTAEEGQLPEFAVVMFDCNGLKLINDDYGHNKGDVYLKASCRLICKTFAHSPVFRVGGDEFIAVLQDADYARRDALLAEFDRNAEAINAGAGNPWERVCISKGMAVFNPATDVNVETVLSRADGLMYTEKRRFKLGR